MAGENIPQTDSALLRAQAEAGPAGVAAYQAAKDELARTQGASLSAAVGAADARGGPAGAMGSALGEAQALYDRRQASLTQGQARAGVREANRTQRMADYSGAVNEARVLIGDQVQGALAPMRLQSEYSLQQMRQQGDNKVGEIRSQMDLDAARYAAELRAAEQEAAAEQARWEREMEQRERLAASSGSGGGGSGGGSGPGGTLNEGELKSMLTAGAQAKIAAAIQNAGTFIENKNRPGTTTSSQTTRQTGNQRDPLHIGRPGVSPRNTAASNQRGVVNATTPASIRATSQTTPQTGNQRDPLRIGNPAVPVSPRNAATATQRGNQRDPRFIGRPAVPQSRAPQRTPADSQRDPRFIGNPAVPVREPTVVNPNVSRGGARPAGPSDIGYIAPGASGRVQLSDGSTRPATGDERAGIKKAFSADELKYFAASPEGSIYSSLIGSGGRAPTSGTDVANIIGNDPEAMQNAMVLAYQDLLSEGYDISEAEFRAAIGQDDAYDFGGTYADLLGVTAGVGTTEEQGNNFYRDLMRQQGQEDRARNLEWQEYSRGASIEDRSARLTAAERAEYDTSVEAGVEEEAALRDAELRSIGVFPDRISSIPLDTQYEAAYAGDGGEAWATYAGWLEDQRDKLDSGEQRSWAQVQKELKKQFPGLKPTENVTDQIILDMLQEFWNS